MKAVVAAFNQEKALVGAFSVITNLRMQLFEALMKAGKGNSSVADNFLVDFSGGGGREEEEEDLDGSFSYPASRPDEEWVEYTDALGRTRQCMKKDLKTLQRQDREMVRDEDQVGLYTGVNILF